MIECLFCNASIEDDSFFCDQCGEALKKCQKCGTYGKGKRCTQCGDIMIVLSEEVAPTLSPTPAQANQTPEVTPIVPPVPVVKDDSVYEATIRQSDMPVLTFQNSVLHINFSVEHNDIIGRRQGRFTHIFANYNQVSGTHAKLIYDNKMGWCIEDMNSTNGCLLNGKKILPNTLNSLTDNSLVTIAHIEFLIRIK